MHRTAIVGLALCAVSVAAPHDARAQSDAATSANRVHQEGVALSREGRWREALTRFEQACALLPSPACMRWQVVAQHRLGNAVDAARALARYDALRSDASHPEVEQVRAAVLGAVARIRLVPQAPLAAGSTLAIDGRAVPAAALDDVVVLTPGAHLVDLRSPGCDPVRLELQVAGGQERAVDLATPAPAVPLTSRWWFWTGIGVVAVGAVTAAVLVATSGEGPGPGIPNQLGATVQAAEVR